ncbi:hypothetical protein, partial [Allosalinactinospora lopnorensis]|uniref:hypothetical protein n=1 Tax=Allosalinactinospora lopnorensis TaxID=1352348 RepID=UPI000623C18C
MATTAPASARPRRLGARTRKAVLVTHIVSVSVWIGLDAALGVLVFTALLTDDTQVAAVAWQALVLIALWPMFTASLAGLASGAVLGLGGKYGLVRYWWVAVKLAINLLMSALILFALRPGLVEAAAYGRELATGSTALPEPTGLLFPVFVAPTLLLIAVLLSVYKPWGRIRERAAPSRR